MDIKNIVEKHVQKLTNEILKEDPKAEIKLTPSAVKIITNNPQVQPVFDLHITSNGKRLMYNIVINGNQLQALPVLLGGK